MASFLFSSSHLHLSQNVLVMRLRAVILRSLSWTFSFVASSVLFNLLIDFAWFRVHRKRFLREFLIFLFSSIVFAWWSRGWLLGKLPSVVTSSPRGLVPNVSLILVQARAQVSEEFFAAITVTEKRRCINFYLIMGACAFVHVRHAVRRILQQRFAFAFHATWPRISMPI